MNPGQPPLIFQSIVLVFYNSFFLPTSNPPLPQKAPKSKDARILF